ncbi:unnamed protein product [Pleuronectes platessa]|uniref:Uncharacterized protein n=1 Tax=Pleuronectes platessa TaxID=8262 RepID=A0A9N7VYL1_PLEPL|nr:unnamed protein product [Pleuronectes platessa]
MLLCIHILCSELIVFLEPGPERSGGSGGSISWGEHAAVHQAQETDGSREKLRWETSWFDSRCGSTNRSNVVLNDLLQLLMPWFLLQGKCGYSTSLSLKRGKDEWKATARGAEGTKEWHRRQLHYLLTIGIMQQPLHPTPGVSEGARGRDYTDGFGRRMCSQGR